MMVLMSTTSPEAMCGAIESPDTCGVRMKKASASMARRVSCALALATERHCNCRSTRSFSRLAPQNPRAVQRPENQECVSGEVRLLTFTRSAFERAAHLRETPDVRIFGIVAVVAHHEVAVCRNPIGRAPVFARRNVRLRWVERLIRAARILNVNAVVLNDQVVVGRLRDVRFRQ